MDLFRKKQNQSLRNKTLKSKPFQNTRNYFTNLKSSVKNYFAKRQANKEGRPFRPTQKIKESRQKLELMDLKKKAKNAMVIHNEPEGKNLNAEEVNINAFGNIPIGNAEYLNLSLPVKNSLAEANRQIRLAREDFLELSAFDDALKEKKFFFEKQELVKANEAMLQKYIESGLDHLKQAKAIASSIKEPKFKQEEAVAVLEEIASTEDLFQRFFLRFDNLYEYTDNMARMNIKKATFLAKQGKLSNIPKALEKVRYTGVQGNAELIGEYGQKLLNLKQKMERNRRNRVTKMQRGLQGGKTRKHKH